MDNEEKNITEAEKAINGVSPLAIADNIVTSIKTPRIILFSLALSLVSVVYTLLGRIMYQGIGGIYVSIILTIFSIVFYLFILDSILHNKMRGVWAFFVVSLIQLLGASYLLFLAVIGWYDILKMVSFSSIIIVGIYLIFLFILSIWNVVSLLKYRRLLLSSREKIVDHRKKFFWMSFLSCLLVPGICFFWISSRSFFPVSYPQAPENFFVLPTDNESKESELYFEQDQSAIIGGRASLGESLLSKIREDLQKTCAQGQKCDYEKDWIAFSNSQPLPFDSSKSPREKYTPEQIKSLVGVVDSYIPQIREYRDHVSKNSSGLNYFSFLIASQRFLLLRNYLHCRDTFDKTCIDISVMNFQFAQNITLDKKNSIVLHMVGSAMLDSEIQFISFILPKILIPIQLKTSYIKELETLKVDINTYKENIWYSINLEQIRVLYLLTEEQKLGGISVNPSTITSIKNFYYDRYQKHDKGNINFKIDILRPDYLGQINFYLMQIGISQYEQITIKLIATVEKFERFISDVTLGKYNINAESSAFTSDKKDSIGPDLTNV